MRKLIAAAVALALLLSACATVPPTEPLEIAWRTLDLEDEANAELRAWLEEALAQAAEEQQQLARTREQLISVFEQTGEIDWGNGIITRNYIPAQREIVLRAAGEETVLLRSSCTRNPPHRPEEYEDCVSCMEGPRFITMLNERYFLFKRLNLTNTVIRHGVYDIQTLREYPINLGRVYFSEQRGDTLFWENYGEFETYYGHLSLYAADLTFLPNLEPVNLLEGIAHAPVQMTQEGVITGSGLVQASYLTQGERYYIAAGVAGLTIFDLQERSVFHLPKSELGFAMGSAREQDNDMDWTHAYLQYFILRDDNTLIWFSDFPNPNMLNMSIAVELTLP